MRRTALALALAVAAGPTTAAFMDPPQTPRERCDAIEYAELNDMPRADLERAYCQAGDLARQRVLEADTAGKMAGAVGGSYARQRDAFERYGAACREQAERMRGIFARRFSAEPACSPPSPAPK